MVEDLIDTLAGLVTGTPAHALRHARAKVVTSTAASHAALFDPAMNAPTLTERLAVAVLCCAVAGTHPLLSYYRTQLMTRQRTGASELPDEAVQALARGEIPPALPQPLEAMLRFACTLIEAPATADRNALHTLPAAGLSVPATVVTAQLIAYLSYQMRVVAGLTALRTWQEGASA